jgi:hypothetical protein
MFYRGGFGNKRESLQLIQDTFPTDMSGPTTRSLFANQRFHAVTTSYQWSLRPADSVEQVYAVRFAMQVNLPAVAVATMSLA